tara:strand:- start:541 stop:966 length:426 start_codon:yes stop_codon:yes gene_type:complete
MRLNKTVVQNAMDGIISEEFTFNELFRVISKELKIEDPSYPVMYRFNDVVDTVTTLTGVSREKMRSRTRVRGIVDVRQVTMYLVEKYTRLTLSKTGELFNRDHATVLHAKKRVKDAKNGYNEELRQIVDLCETSLITENPF